MTETFEVGQKVKAFGTSEGEITYGPFSSTFGGYTAYVVRIGGVEKLHKTAELAAIPESPKFAVGDVVTLATRAGAKATVEYGPFDDRDVYVVKLVEAPDGDDNPRTFTAMAHGMTKVVEPEPIKVGDRVRVLAASYAEETHGKVGTATEVNAREQFDGIRHPFYVEFGPSEAVFASSVERVADEHTYTHEGVTYDLTADYRDKDGDVWSFVESGSTEPRMECPQELEGSRALSYVVDNWGPLTRR